MARKSSNKVPKNAPKKVSKNATLPVARIQRQQATQSDKRRVERNPQRRPTSNVLSPRTRDKFRNLRDQVRLELLQGDNQPQTDALDLSVGVPSTEFSDGLNVSLLVASFVPDEAALINLSEQVLEVLGTTNEIVPPSTSAAPLMAPAIHEIEDDGTTLDETLVPTPSTSSSSSSSSGLSGNATNSVVVDDEDDDIMVIEQAGDLPASGPHNVPTEQLLLESPKQETSKAPNSLTEEILLAELSRVANRKARPVPLLMDYRDHHESSDRIRKVREAYPHEYVGVYLRLNPPYAKEKRIPEGNPPFLPLTFKLIPYNFVFYHLGYPWSVRHGHCGMCAKGRSLGLETVQELSTCRPIPGNSRTLIDLALICPQCGEVFFLPGLLQLHIENLHAGSGWDGPAQTCPSCHTASFYP